MKDEKKLGAAQVYWSVASLWHGAGAPDPRDGLEAMLEWLAFMRLEETNVHHRTIERELTANDWFAIRRDLSDALRLPRHEMSPSHYSVTTPGIYEQTRRLANAAAPAISGKTAGNFMGDLLSVLMGGSQVAGRRATIGEFLWPEYLSELFIALLNKSSSKPIYVPFDSSGWLPLVLARAGWPVDCEVENEQTARIFGLFGFLGGWSVRAHISDPLRRPTLLEGGGLMRFAQSVAITSFGIRRREETETDPYKRYPVRLAQGEARQLAHMVAQTEGRIALVVPESFLFRSAGGERDYKEQLVRRGILSAVIRLPRSTFSPYTNVQTSMLLLETAGRNGTDVLFVDASEDLAGKSHGAPHHDAREGVMQIAQIVTSRQETRISTRADYDRISHQDFNISVDRYVRSDEDQRLAATLEGVQTVELGDIAEIIRPQSFPRDGTGAVEIFGEVSLQDIGSDGRVSPPAKRIEVDERNIAKLMKQRITRGDVLVSVRGRIGTVGMVGEIEPTEETTGWLASQAFVLVRLRETSPITPLTLYRYLSSPLGQGLLQSVATGMSVPMVSMGDIKKLRIMVPSRHEQARIKHEYSELSALREQIKALEERYDRLLSKSWPMNET